MRVIIIVCFLVLVIGLAGGFYLALYFQNQAVLLASVAVIFAFLNWFGSGTTLIGLVQKWYREKKEKVKFVIEYQPQQNEAPFEPIIEMISNTGQRLNVIRKYIRVGIRNDGGKIARQCKATLQFRRTSSDDTRTPSPEPKNLLWVEGGIYRDIGIKRTEYLQVILSDNRLGSVIPEEQDLFAFISTPDTVNMIPPNFFRAQDGFGVGELNFELVISSEDGENITSNLHVHVTNNWRELLMEIVEDS